MRGIDLGQLFIPRWGSTSIERSVVRCLKHCQRQLGLQEIPLPVPVEEWIETVFDIRFGVADLSYLGDYVLGAGFIKDREILISDKITDLDGRFRFTCAHELGHFVLHAKRQEVFQDTDVEQPFQSDEFEREADRFAAAFLIPIALFERELFAICERRRLNEVQCLKRLIRPTVESHWLWRKVFLPEITKRFGVSVSAAVIRCRDLRLKAVHELPFMPNALQKRLLRPATDADELDAISIANGVPVKAPTLFDAEQER